MGLVLTQGLAIGGKEVPIYAYSYALAIDLAAGDANITLTNTDGSDYKVQWGDGEYTTQSSGVAATHTYASDYDGNIIIRSETPITALSSTDGDWDFDVSILPDSITSLDFGFAGVALTGSPADLPSSLVTLDLGGSSSVLAGELDDFPSGLTSIDINATGSTLTGFLADLPSGLAYLDMSSTSIEVYGDLSDLPASLAYVDLSDTATTITANSAVAMTSARGFYLQDTNMSSDNVDSILAKLADITTWVTEQAVNLGGNNASRTSSSDADKTTLEGNSVTVTVNENSPTYADTSWIGVGTRQGDSAAITVDFPTHAADDLLCFGVVCRHNDTPATPAGWSTVTTPQISGSTDLTSIQVVVYYKFATGAGTTVTLADFGNMHLSRGFAIGSVDQTTPINDFVVTINSGSGVDVAATSHTFDGVVTTVPKARVVTIVGWGEDGAAPTGWANSSLVSITEEIDDSTTSGSDCGHAVAQGVMNTAGDIGNTTVTTSVSVESVAIQIAFTPTSSGGVALPTTQATLAINQTATPANLTVSTSDASVFIVDWGDGTISAEVASGGTATHTYGAVYDGNITVHSTATVTSIESTQGGWDFTLSALPSTCTRLYLSNCVDAAITGALSDLPASFDELNVFNTGSVITGNLGDEPSTMTKLYVSDTSSTIGGNAVNMTSNMQFLSMKNSSCTAHFDIDDLPAGFKALRLSGSSCTMASPTTTVAITEMNNVDCQDLSLTTAQVDAVLLALANVPSWTGQKFVNLGGNNEGRTPSTTDAAVTAIEAFGVTVTASVIPDGGGDIERVGLVAQITTPAGVLPLGGANEFDEADEEMYNDGGPYAGGLNPLEVWGPSDGTPSAVEDTYCHRIAWDVTQPLNSGKIRAELKNPSGVTIPFGQDFHFGIAFYIPDTANMRANCEVGLTNNHIMQFHQISPISGTSGINLRNGRYKLSVATKPEIDVGPIVYGAWNKLVMSGRLSSGSDGFIKVWLNPTVVGSSPTSDPVYEYLNQSNNNGPLRIKWGIYRGAVPIHNLTYFYDCVRVGNASSNFISVYPGTV